MPRHLVLAIFDDEASADAAADGLKRWAEQDAAAKTIDTHTIQAIWPDERGGLRARILTTGILEPDS